MRRILFWVGLLISILFLWLALRGLDFSTVWHDLQNANLWWIPLGIIAYFLAVAVRAMRWGYLIRPLKPLTLTQLYPIVVIGYMGNNIYPARIGELVRAYLLRRKFDVPIAYSLSTIFLERVFDGLTMVAFVLIGLTQINNLPELLSRALNLAIVFFAVAIAGFLLMALAPSKFDALAHAIATRILPHRLQTPVLNLTSRFVQGAQALRSPRDVAGVVVATIATWLIETVKYGCVALSLGLPLKWLQLMFINGISNLALVVPSGPGGAGTFDLAGKLATVASGIPDQQAATYALALHVVLWVPVTLLGAYFMLREGVHWADLQSAEHTA
jgi:uncharacterized protein (TIRG00374 family)